MGSIPARAGEPLASELSPDAPSVYPRACGGTVMTASRLSSIRGLSPRVRGNRLVRTPNEEASGSIPARAGEPRTWQAHNGPAMVYPRACGGTADVPACKPGGKGLSPRVRGNLNVGVVWEVGTGSIPARAGEPTASSGLTSPAPVYPRACGGTWFIQLFTKEGDGLSPRVRGNRRLTTR